MCSCQATSSGLMSVGIQTSTPVVYGVLNVNTEQQALDRATGPDNHGISWAQVTKLTTALFTHLSTSLDFASLEGRLGPKLRETGPQIADAPPKPRVISELCCPLDGWCSDGRGDGSAARIGTRHG